IVSHHDNNYAGAVKNLNKVEAEIARVNKDTPGFLVSGLKDRELGFSNSMILHEQYFGNLGGNGKPGGAISSALGDAFGGLALGGALPSGRDESTTVRRPRSTSMRSCRT